MPDKAYAIGQKVVTSQIIKAGKILVLTSGEYSDYSIDAWVEVLKDFDPDEEKREYLKCHPPTAEYLFDDSVSTSQFILWMESRGLLYELDPENSPLELHIHSCGTFSDSDGNEIQRPDR